MENNGNLTEMMKRRAIFPDEQNGEPIPSQMPGQPQVTPQAQEEIQRATGLRIPKFDQDEADAAPKTSWGVLTPDEAAQFTQGEKIDVEKEIDANRIRKAEEAANAKKNDLISMINDVQAQEEKRLIEQEEIFKDPDKLADKVGGGSDGPVRNVTYNAPMAEEGQVPRGTEPGSEPVARQVDNIYNNDDLLPSYNYNEEEDKEKAIPEAEEKTERPNPGEKEYTEYIKNLEVAYAVEDKEPKMIEMVQEKSYVEPVPSDRFNKTKTMGDQAFMSAINKFKKDNFRTVTIPLVNSGFCVDVVGTGAVDLNLLYTSVDQNTMAYEYTIAKMRTIIRNVVGTHPKINNNNLSDNIHFADYQLLAYAHTAATLKTIETVQSCSECGKDFHITANSNDLILNMDAMRDKMEKIKNADDAKRYSLMSFDNRIVTRGGFIITLSHPSYRDYINYMNEYRELTEKLQPAEANHLQNMANLLPYVRSVLLPNNVSTNNLYQRYIALTMLSDTDYAQVVTEVNKMVEKIIVPEFGIRSVECPHCHKMNTNIKYDNLDDLLFFHITVTHLLNGIGE